MEGEVLERRKLLHIRELKRVRDQRASQYRENPVLNRSSYVLLELLGKGGFSEVWRGFDLNRYRYYVPGPPSVFCVLPSS
eukprot:COSAG05_NODE_807_length_7192_cov_92.394191_5_plen_80_part_00